jgi:hypothetical protein
MQKTISKMSGRKNRRAHVFQRNKFLTAIFGEFAEEEQMWGTPHALQEKQRNIRR